MNLIRSLMTILGVVAWTQFAFGWRMHPCQYPDRPAWCETSEISPSPAESLFIICGRHSIRDVKSIQIATGDSEKSIVLFNSGKTGRYNLKGCRVEFK